MDPLTHAASGALLALSCKERPRSMMAVPLAALAAASPDVDIFFAALPLDFLLLHRGITHALPALPFMGLILALCMFPWWRGTRPGQWSFGKTYLLAMGLVLLHIWLDCVTTYGTMIFLPFSAYRVRLNGLFIIDLLIIMPMLAALMVQRRQPPSLLAGPSAPIRIGKRGMDRARTWALGALVWIVLYPATCVGLRALHQHNVAAALTAQGAQQVTVLPDALAPLFWRVIYSTSAVPATVFHQGLDWRAAPRTEAKAFPAAHADKVASFAGASTSATAFFDFTLLPVQESKPWPQGGEEYTFYDLRFATMLPLMQKIMHLRNDGAPSFLLQGRYRDDQWVSERMRFSGAGRDSGWQVPRPPQPVDTLPYWRWLLGLR